MLTADTSGGAVALPIVTESVLVVAYEMLNFWILLLP
ncbi:MAG: hypothetical protein BWY28_02740 [bacterium ADurb.Bin236]|nr:MAG: hypothetical protein BWY28_02740 [bacterium ADurb.Bin236]